MGKKKQWIEASDGERPASSDPSSRRWASGGLPAVGLAFVALLVIAIYFLQLRNAPSTTPASAPIAVEQPLPAAQYVGAAACQQCHESEFKAWSGSHHQLAMQVANDKSVLGDFANVKFKNQGVESSFFKRGEKFMVRSDGLDGKLVDYEISYTFGVYPLQQYLIAFPGGRYQVLPIAWDARPKGEGGQRWFHLYPRQSSDPKDPMHWTGIYHNWALQCAECHSTQLRKGYDAASDSYKTTYSEINVACEACHGPASTHVDWARNAKPPYAAQADKGLPVLKSRWKEAWKFPAEGAKFAVRDTPAQAAAMNTCAACHARRSTLTEEGKPGAALEDTHRLSLPVAPNYYVDGQQREEDYVWASFLQSKMHQFGVTCMDCHEPHSQQLRAQGNALCTRCHNAGEFDAPKHHQHVAGGKGAQCVTCHMPTQNYMTIHARQDHSLRVPRPDLSISLGSPNACNQCHTDKKPQWAASAMDKWYGKAWRERPHYGNTLHTAEAMGAGSLPGLLELANNTAAPAIIRATAATLAQPYANPGTLETARSLLRDSDPLIRIAALGMLEPADRVNRLLSVAPSLSDPIRGVRIEAARILADIPDSQLSPDQRATRAAALAELETALQLESDWPSGNVNLGNLRLRQGRADEAVAAFELAIVRDRGLVGAYINLADAMRQQRREPEAETALRKGLAVAPNNADLHHALGLLLVRIGDKPAALRELALAAKLAPQNTRYAYVYAVGLHAAGKSAEALAHLRAVNQRQPSDLETLSALVSINREAGNKAAALAYAKQLVILLPDNAGVQRLLAELENH